MPTTLRSLTVALGAVVLLATLVACSTAAPDLNGREFLSVGVSEGGAPRALVAGTRVRLRFSALEVGTNAGCNELGGSYRIELGRLLYERGAQTAMGCDALLAAQDEWLVDFLDSDPMVVASGNDLQLTNGSISMRLLDRDVAEPDLYIVGPTWTVDSIIQGDAVSSAPAGATATLVFKADGTVDVNAGCNRGTGTWKLEGTGLGIADLATTKMGCPGAAGQLEDAVLGVLRSGGLAAQIDANLLTLSAGGTGLQLRGSQPNA